MLIAHADWSLHPGKRWLAVATRSERGWLAEAPALLGLLGMIAVATDDEPAGIPTPDQLPHVRTVEGWILGVPAQIAETPPDAEPRSP